MSIQIHQTALVAEGAVLGEGTTVGPYSIIGPRVVLGRNNTVASHVVIEGNTRAGDENQFFQFCSIGSRPQDLKYNGEDSTVEIGHRNLIREYVTIQPGTRGGGMRTTVGDGNLLMGSVHIGHDSTVGNGNVIANGVAVAGHVSIGSFVIVGGLSGIHQFVRLGDLSFIGAGAMVSQDIPPFCMAQGDRASLVGLNKVGLQRRGYDEASILEIKRVYRELFVSRGNFRAKLDRLLTEASTGAPRVLLEFISASSRGVAQGRSAVNLD
ncbi:MAG: acyl-ACP--UDP-N-acetylglucosamine O-acyltransferase [Proteobacteria bacterium]|nr:acyl-ACP--UDP-N-acetylglucosamine O-acyltransferase [Pseudomonadota bacterium]